MGRWVASREHLPPAVRRACLQQLLDGYFRQVTYMRKGWSTHRGGASIRASIAMVQHLRVRVQSFVHRYGTACRYSTRQLALAGVARKH